MAARADERPRVRVAALIVIDGRIVFVRHAAGDSRYHLLPGGGVDYRETLEEALTREVLEETGLEVSVGAPVLLSDTIDPSGTRHVINLTFRATVIGGALSKPADPRVEAVDLVPVSEVSGLDLRPPMAEAVIAAVSEGENSPARYLGSLYK